MFSGNISLKKISKIEYELLEDLVYSNKYYNIIIKQGMKTDGASIPKIFWSLIGSPFIGKYTEAALIHDGLYASESLNRAKCDELFLEMMKVLGVSFFKRYTMYYAVRSGGWIVWKNHNKKEVDLNKEFIEITSKIKKG